MPWEAWFTLIVALSAVTLMAKSSVAPDGALVLSALSIVNAVPNVDYQLVVRRIGFSRDDSGKVISPYGRIQMIVDGETIDMLLDTGATTHLSPAALAQLPGDADRDGCGG